MKQTILFLFFSIINCYSQIYKVKYDVDGAFGDKTTKLCKASLIFNNSNAVYVYKFANQKTEETISIGANVTTTSATKNTVYAIFTDKKKDSLFEKNYIFHKKNYYTKDKAFVINWNLKREKKKIGKYLCSKATTHFRGRDYTAWYTTEIPTSFGPWKLNGLPGLIVEAHSGDNIHFYFRGIKEINQKKPKLKLPNSIKRVSLITHVKSNKKRMQRLDAKVRAENKRDGSKHSIGYYSIENNYNDLEPGLKVW